jgi:hypothetical protein
MQASEILYDEEQSVQNCEVKYVTDDYRDLPEIKNRQEEQEVSVSKNLQSTKMGLWFTGTMFENLGMKIRLKIGDQMKLIGSMDNYLVHEFIEIEDALNRKETPVDPSNYLVELTSWNKAGDISYYCL